MEQKAKNLAIKARDSLSRYCCTECKSYCCRKGFLVLDKKEADAVCSGKRLELIGGKILTITKDNEFSLDLSKSISGCLQLKDSRCMIHDHKDLPKTCKEFPLFLWENKVIQLSNRCPAVRNQLLYPYLAKFKLLGYSTQNIS